MLKLELSSLLPSRCSIAGVFIMLINQAFRCTCWGTSCRKQVHLGTERMGNWRMLRAARCIPRKYWANRWGESRKDVDVIKNDVQIWLLISTYCVNVIYTHIRTTQWNVLQAWDSLYTTSTHVMFCSVVHTLFITFPFKKIFPGRKLKFQFGCECLTILRIHSCQFKIETESGSLWSLHLYLD